MSNLSLTVHFTAVDVDKVRKVLGSGKRRVLKRILEAEAETFLGGNVATIRPILESAILQGVPIPGLRFEGRDHADAAQALVWVYGQHPFSPSNIVSTDQYRSFLDRVLGAPIPPIAREPVLWLRDGRPLFGGEHRAPDHTTYGMMDRQEIGELTSDLDGTSGTGVAFRGPVIDVLHDCVECRLGLFWYVPA